MQASLLSGTHYVGLTGTTSALFAASVLLCLPVGPRRAGRLMAILLALLAVHGVGEHLSSLGGFQTFPHLLLVGSTLSTGLMPLLYLYARTLADPHTRCSRRDLRHAIPCLIQLTLRLPFFLQDAATKLQHPPPGWDRACNRSLLLLLTVGYGYGLFQVHRRHEQRLPEQQSDLDGRHLTWILVLAGSWSVIVLMEGLATWGHWHPPLALLGGLLTLATAFLALTRLPMHEWHRPQPSDHVEHTEPMTASEGIRPAQAPLLSPAREREILARVQTYLETHAPHLEPDLSLISLAGRLRLPPSYLSRALNHQAGQNFFTFINAHRVAAAQRMLRHEPGRPILDIALATGFASKSTFNSVFKKLTGMTPSAYRAAGPTSGKRGSEPDSLPVSGRAPSPDPTA